MKGVQGLWPSLGLLLFGFAARAQETAPVDSLEASRKTLSQTLIVEGGQIQGSRSLPFSAVRGFVYSGAVTDEDKTAVSEAFNPINNYGNALEARVAFRQWNPKRKIGAQQGFEFGLVHQQAFGARFGEDAGRLALDGNAQFEEQTAELEPLEYALYSWYEAYYEQLFRTDRWQASVGLGFVLGSGYESYSMERGSLYTAPSGEFVDVDAQYTFRRSGDPGFLGGMGASVRAQFEHRSTLDWMTRFGVRDLGYVQWNSLSTTVEADSSFRFEGEEFPNIFDLRDSLLTGTDDRLTDAYFTSEAGSFGSFLPFELYAGIERQIHPRNGLDRYGLDVRYRHLPGALPKASAYARWVWNRWLLLPELSYGGFTGLGVGVGFGHRGNDWEWMVRGRDLQGLIAPNIGGGLGFEASVRYRLY
ncbi:hypothetical protein GC167_04105 [bacterium]|nr:hypothetical protein [bacterium]